MPSWRHQLVVSLPKIPSWAAPTCSEFAENTLMAAPIRFNIKAGRASLKGNPIHTKAQRGPPKNPPNKNLPSQTPNYQSTMEISTSNPPRLLFPFYHYAAIPHNYVHWVQTSDSHLFSADLPGVRKEEIKVEVEDSRYLIIRTEAVDGVTMPAKSFSRKFRLPVLVDVDAISAGFENGVLEITVPRSFRRGSVIHSPDQLQLLARAA